MQTNSELVDDLVRLIDRHPQIAGREFLEACERAAQGCWPADQLPETMDIGEFAALFAQALKEAPPLQVRGVMDDLSERG